MGYYKGLLKLNTFYQNKNRPMMIKHNIYQIINFYPNNQINILLMQKSYQ